MINPDLKKALLRWRKAEIEYGRAVLRSALPTELREMERECDKSAGLLCLLVDKENWNDD